MPEVQWRRALSRRGWRGRAARFASITVITATLGQTLIFVLYNSLGLPGVLANGLAVVAVTAVGYLLCTRYVWSSDPVRRARFELPVFWSLYVLGFVVSTIAVALATTYSDHPLVVNVASAVSYLVVWAFRFLVLDRYVFRAVFPPAVQPDVSEQPLPQT